MRHPLVGLSCATLLLGSVGCSTLSSGYDWTRAYFGSAQTAAARQPIAETESTLLAAGFRQLPANSGDELKQLKSLPPQQISYTITNGAVVYRFADPDYCRCIYVGSDKAYQAYEQLTAANESEKTDKGIAVIRRQATQQEALDSVNDLNPFRYDWF
ncbi:MAG TPA: hypothetical protein VMB26_16020 [Candidatus Binataceae bacterium]|nr:hypothetical protein [Candidatus Binataceae bacterium]